MRITSPKASLLALSLVSAFAGPAFATTVTLDLSATTTSSANGIAGTTVGSVSPTYVNSSSSGTDALGQGSAYSFANQYGAYAVHSNSQGIATGNADAALKYVITNDSGLLTHYSITFKIYGGSISAQTVGGGLLIANESLHSEYRASIKVNGSSVFDSSASIDRQGNTTTFVKQGFDLSIGTDDGFDGAYGWGAHYETIDLGNLAAGASVEVLAELNQRSSANVGFYAFDSGLCGGYGGYDTITASSAVAGGDCFKGYGQGFYGDPAAISFNDNDSTGANDPVVIRSAVVGQIPEPGTVGLTLLGLMAAASRRRRTRRS